MHSNSSCHNLQNQGSHLPSVYQFICSFWFCCYCFWLWFLLLLSTNILQRGFFPPTNVLALLHLQMPGTTCAQCWGATSASVYSNSCFVSSLSSTAHKDKAPLQPYWKLQHIFVAARNRYLPSLPCWNFTYRTPQKFKTLLIPCPRFYEKKPQISQTL